jgi:post-segregation antitoxin (ccd killing protein)
MSSKPLSKFSYSDMVNLSVTPEAVPKPVKNWVPSLPKLGTQSTQSPGTLGTQSTQATQSILGTQAGFELSENLPDLEPKKPKWKDNREQLNLKLPQQLLENLRRYAFDNRLTVTEAVMRGVETLLGTQSTQATLGTLGRNLPSLDLMIDDDDRTISELYEKATGNTFTDRDREFLAKYREFGVDCLTLAILTGRNRTRAKINSLKFFENNIREEAAKQPDKIKADLPFQWARFNRRYGREGK